MYAYIENKNFRNLFLIKRCLSLVKRYNNRIKACITKPYTNFARQSPMKKTKFAVVKSENY